MVISIRAVPPIWVAAPSNVQSAKSRFMAGNAAWVEASTAKRNISAKGKPNRKRTRVAPSAPSRGVSSRCMALRAVWPAAPSKVKMTQRKLKPSRRFADRRGFRRRRTWAQVGDAAPEIDHAGIDGERGRHPQQQI